MRTALALSHLEIRPGSSERVEIEVTNTSDVIDGVMAIVDGIDPDWVRFDAPVVSLFPESSAILGFSVDVPFDCPAGDYLVVVRVVSTIDADRQAVHDFWIRVAPSLGIGLAIRPSLINAGSKAEIFATVKSTGNTTASIAVTALDPGRQVDCRIEVPTLAVPPGHEGTTRVLLRGPRPWFGQPASRSIIITATSDDRLVEEVATFNQKPRIPRGVLTALMLAGIIALWAAIFLLVARSLGDDTPPAKATATAFVARGEPNIPLAAIAGTASGTVTAATTGEGLPRVTVEAFRLDANGDPHSSGSAATDENGMYQFASLLPGTYRFSFSGEGFPTVWYKDALAPEQGELIPIAPKQVVPGLDVELAGRLGSLTGQIAIPDSAGETTLTVTATEIVQDGQEPVVKTMTTTTGEISLGELPTPARYTIRVEGANFDPQEFEVALEPGQASLLNTVTLGAATGSVSGTVVDSNGNALGGVAVVATSGELRYESTTPTTPTAGAGIGQFTLIGLETPRTYVLTFSLDGYTSQTMALELLAGQDLEGVPARLVIGSGTVSGTARDASGAPLGGVAVAVAGNQFQAESSTLTTAGPDGGVGSYRVGDVPVPGTYTVTFTAPGYLPETVRVSFLGAGEQPGTDVVMRPALGTVEGTVFGGAGGGLGAAAVELSDGTDEGIRATTTATSPAGAFVFTDVAAGTYTLRFQAPGYIPYVALIEVSAGGTVERSVRLTPGAA